MSMNFGHGGPFRPGYPDDADYSNDSQEDSRALYTPSAPPPEVEAQGTIQYICFVSGASIATSACLAILAKTWVFYTASVIGVIIFGSLFLTANEKPLVKKHIDNFFLWGPFMVCVAITIVKTILVFKT